MGRQYAQLADLLGAASAELSRELIPDLLGDRKLRQRVAELGLDIRTAVYRDSRGLLRVEAEGPGCAALARPSRCPTCLTCWVSPSGWTSPERTPSPFSSRSR